MSWIKQFRSVFWRSWLTFNRDVVIFRVRLYQSIVRATDIISRWLRFMFFLSYAGATDSEVATAQVVETSDGPITDYDYPDDHARPTWEMTPGFKQFTDRSSVVLNSGKILPTCRSFFVLLIKQADYDLLTVTMLAYQMSALENLCGFQHQRKSQW